MSNLYLCNFATKNDYGQFQIYQREYLQSFYRDIFEYDNTFLKESGFYNHNKYIFEHSQGRFGYCCWKPFIILDAMDKIEYGDTLMYLDVADFIYNFSFFDYFEQSMRKNNQKFFTINSHAQGKYTSMDCFIGMGCDNSDYYCAKQLEAGTLGFQKNADNINFLHEWLSWCTIPEIICKNMNFYGIPNLPEFIDHRADQSILTNLFYKYKFSGNDIMAVEKFISYNYYDKKFTKIG
jgi:hypothetical protein